MNRWVTAELAEVIAKGINDEKWSYRLCAKRRYAPVRYVADGENTTVNVVPLELEGQSVVDRTMRVNETHIVSVCVQRGIRNPEDNEEIDPLMKLVEQIADWARRRKKEVVGDLTVGFQTAQIALVQEHLFDPGIFTGVAQLTYRIVRA